MKIDIEEPSLQRKDDSTAILSWLGIYLVYFTRTKTCSELRQFDQSLPQRRTQDEANPN